MPPLSATLITYNEEKDLPQALRSLAGIADEIVVVDSGSTDGTREIAGQLGAKVLTRAFQSFDEQKNYAATAAAHDWVFSMDADEVVSAGLRASLLAWKAAQPHKPAYEVTRKTNYLGGWIRHSGWYPEYRTRLYRRDAARFVGAIHESVQLDGKGPQPSSSVGRLSGDLLHYTIRSLPEHYAKQEAFTTKAAEDLFARGRRNWWGGMLIAAPWVLVQKFLLQQGFLDGYRGALIAWTSARYVWIKYHKLHVLLRGGRLEDRPWPQSGDA